VTNRSLAASNSVSHFHRNTGIGKDIFSRSQLRRSSASCRIVCWRLRASAPAIPGGTAQIGSSQVLRVRRAVRVSRTAVWLIVEAGVEL
jgi:hypothetical protein